MSPGAKILGAGAPTPHKVSAYGVKIQQQHTQFTSQAYTV